MTNIFILCSGQEDNIGDVVLRRAMLTQLRAFGSLHAYLGSASDDFIDGLDLGPEDTVYTEKSAWRRAAWRSTRKSPTWFVDKPGELLLDARHVIAQLRLLPLQLWIKARRGLVLRLGLGLRAQSRSDARRVRWAFRLSNIVRWRDTDTAATFGIGETMPDWGFGEREQGTPAPVRDRLVLSYRGDRPELSKSVQEGLADAADQAGLKLTVVCQVGRDNPRTRALAESMGADVIDWPSDRTHKQQEQVLRDTYAQAVLAISDRLHVLIVGMTEGAAPLCLVQQPEAKVERHFRAIGLANVSRVVHSENREATRAIVADAIEHASASMSHLDSATAELDAVSREIRRRSTRPIGV